LPRSFNAEVIMLVSRLVLGIALATALGLASIGNARAAASEISMGSPAPATGVPFSVYFPLTHTAQLQQFLADVVDPTKPAVYHHWLTPAQFKAAYGADPNAVAQVKAALAAAGMAVTAEHTQSLEVQGPASAVQAMFHVHLNTMQATDSGHQRFVATEGHVTLPSVFAAVGASVVGLELHILNHVHSRRVDKANNPPGARRNIGSNQGYFANDMRAAYGFPSFQTFSAGTGLPAEQQIVGLGTNIGILMSSIALNSDLALAFNSDTGAGAGELVQNYSGNTSLPVPTFTIREVSGGSGPFGDSAAGEASLDTQMSLTTAPGASEQLYDVPDLSDSSILAGYTAIVEDNTVDVVSSSFGGCEFPEIAPNPFNGFVSEGWVLTLEDQIFQQGNAQGITFVASSGDQGSLPCPTDLSATGYYAAGGTSPAAPGVEEPAADPNVTAVGGTNLRTTTPTASLEDAYISENADGDPLISPYDIYSLGSGGMTGGYWGSGGGISQFFSKPAYQNLVETGNATQRTVPDISLQMGGCPGGILQNTTFCNVQPRSFTEVFIGGDRSGLVGTSSSSPQFAGVVALMIQLAGGGSIANPPGPNQPNAPKGRLGNINPLLYRLAAQQIAAGGPNAPANQQYFHNQVPGFAGDYFATATTPYNYLLGVGTPNVTNLLGLQGAAPAGNPGTPSNP
jgi:subtilase family serine protease